MLTILPTQIPPLFMTVDSLRHLVGTCLRPAARRAAAHFCGPEAEAASRGGQAALVAEMYNMDNRYLDTLKILSILDVLCAGASAQLARVQSQLAEARFFGDDDTQQHRRAHFFDGPSENSIRSLHTVFSAGQADMVRQTVEVWPVWRRDMAAAVGESFTLIAHAHAASAPFCVARQEEYLESAVLTLECVVEFLHLCSNAFAHRRDWVVELYRPAACATLPTPDSLGPHLPLLTSEVGASAFVLASAVAAGPSPEVHGDSVCGDPSDKELASALLLGDDLVGLRGSTDWLLPPSFGSQDDGALAV